jgi:hypothetical protein
MGSVVRAAGVAARLVLAPLVAFALLGWWLVGDVSEPGGDDFILQLPFAERHAVALGLAGLVVATGWAVDFARVWLRFQHRNQALWLSGIGVNAGVLAGIGMRVVTARVGGANIGGGLVILATPAAGLGLLVVTSLLSWRIARGSGRKVGG